MFFIFMNNFYLKTKTILLTLLDICFRYQYRAYIITKVCCLQLNRFSTFSLTRRAYVLLTIKPHFISDTLTIYKIKYCYSIPLRKQLTVL